MESLEYIEKYVTQNLWSVINVVWSSAFVCRDFNFWR